MLSDTERQLLQRIERRLAEDDPGLAERLGAPPAGKRRRTAPVAVVLMLAGLGGMLSMLAFSVALSFLFALVAFAGAVLLAAAAAR